MVENRKVQTFTQGSDITTDVITWALPEGAIARLARGRAQDVAFSPKRNTLAVGSRVGVWLYDMSTISPIALWDTERGVVFAVAFSPDGNLLATGNWDGDVKVWDVQSKRCISKMRREGHFDAASQLAFSPDGQRLASSGGRYDAVYVWCPETGEQVAKFTVENAPKGSARPTIIPLTFSPDGKQVAAATPENTFSIWDIETGERFACFSGQTEMVVAITFSPCGRFIASGDRKGTLRQWDVRAAHLIGTPVQYSKNAVMPSYAVAGVLRAAAVYQTTIAVWDVERDEKLETFEHRGKIDAMRFSNGTDLAVTSYSDFKVWTADTAHQVSSIPGHTHVPYSLTLSPDGKTLASVGFGLATCWDVATKQPRRICCAQTHVRSLSFSPDGSRQALGTQGQSGSTLSVWNVETNETFATFTAHEKVPTEAAFAPIGGLWASGDVEGTVYVWDGSGKQTACRGHTESIKALAFSPDEKHLASASRDKTARVWDVASGEQIISLPLSLPVHICLPASRARLAPEVYKGDFDRIESVLNGEKPRSHNPAIMAITFSACGNLIAGGFEGGIRIWDAHSYETYMLLLLQREYRRQYALAFSPCSRYLVSGAWWWSPLEKVPIYVWDVGTGENVATFWGHSTDVQDLAFSPDGTLLASGGFDGTILLWDMKPYL